MALGLVIYLAGGAARDFSRALLFRLGNGSELVAESDRDHRVETEEV
jgi:hypothetical protein